MGFLVNDPLGQGVAVPFLVALFVAAWMRMGGGAAFAARFGALGIGAGFLVAFALVQGIQPFPPPGSIAKTFYIVAAGIALGLVADFGPNERRDAHVFAAVLPLAADSVTLKAAVAAPALPSMTTTSSINSEGSVSSLVIVPVAVPVAMVALTGFASVTENVSSGSMI